MRRTRKWAGLQSEAQRLAGQHWAPRQIAARLGVNKSTVTRWIQAGKLPGNPQSRAHVILDGTHLGRLEEPLLPDRSEQERPWHQLTRAWWRHVWASPMADEYLPSDADGLLRLAMLVDCFNYRPTVKAAAEIRQQERRFLLGPEQRVCR